MKKYIGTKEVNAMPMTLGEFIEKSGRNPYENDGKMHGNNEEGYLVEYENGYRSWSPKDVFEKAYKCSESFLDRLEIEYRDLSDKEGKLTPFITTGKIGEVVTDKYQNHLLRLQLSIMRRYADILHCRIARARGYEYETPSCLTFGDAIEILKQGGAIRRSGWNGKGMFVVKQVPAHIGADVLPKMQSLPQSAKDLILQGRGFINYTAQCLIYNEDTGRADSWVPSISDVFAEDWEIVTHTSVPCDHIPDEGECCGSCCCGS